MNIRDQAFKDYAAGMKYKDIAEKYGVSISCVKSWAARYWRERKVATQKREVATKNKKVATKNVEKVASEKKKAGAPYGNTNAVGHFGGPLFLRNQNSLKHGGYSEIYWDTLSDEEKDLIENMPLSEEMLLIDQLRLLSVRERRLMVAINKCLGAEDGLVVASTSSSETVRAFEDSEDGEAEREKYNELKQQKILEGKISYLGHDKTVVTNCESSYDRILRLERELTAVQGKKAKCIEALAKLHNRETQQTVAGEGTLPSGVDVSGAETVNIYLPDNGRDG